MTAELDDLLTESRTPFSRRLIILLLLGVIIAGAAFSVRRVFFAPSEKPETAVQTAEVKRGAVVNSLSLSGTIAAETTSQLNFEQAGVVTRVNVKLGQQVKAGEVLAEIDSASANDAVKQAELNLAGARISLNALLTGPTAADKTAADQSLQQAQQTLSTAQEDLRKLQAGPTASERTSAQQAVSAAQSSLAQAQATRDKLTAPGTNDRSSQESAVRQAEGSVRNANDAVRTADNTITTAQSSLYAAETAFCPDATMRFCSSRSAPIVSSDESALLGSSAASTADRATKAQAVLQANAAYKNALNGRVSAVASLDSAQRDLSAAQQKYANTPAGPSASELTAADTAITSARQSLAAAQQKLTELTTPDPYKLQTARTAVDTAQAGIAAAQASRDKVYAGTKQSDIDLQRNQVSLSQLSLDKARSDLDKTRILAPFEGTVAALSIQPGDQAQGIGSNNSSGSGSSAAITLNTPNALRLDLTVGESDYSKLKVGQHGLVSLSGLDGASFPIEIESIGTLPSTNQGVVTYAAHARLLMEGSAVLSPSLIPGGPKPGDTTQTATSGTQPGQIIQIGPGAQTTQNQGGAVPVSSTSERPKPAPGMQGQATVITEEKAGVLTVPVRAVSLDGADSVVKVQKDDGSTETVKVKTGSRNAQVVEITDGLKEGQKVVVPPIAAAPADSGSGTPLGSGTSTGGPGSGGGNFIIQLGPGP